MRLSRLLALLVRASLLSSAHLLHLQLSLIPRLLSFLPLSEEESGIGVLTHLRRFTLVFYELIQLCEHGRFGDGLELSFDVRAPRVRSEKIERDSVTSVQMRLFVHGELS